MALHALHMDLEVGDMPLIFEVFLVVQQSPQERMMQCVGVLEHMPHLIVSMFIQKEFLWIDETKYLLFGQDQIHTADH